MPKQDDPALALEQKERADAIAEKNRQAIAQAKAEAANSTTEAKKRLAAQQEAEGVPGENLTERALRGDLEGRFINLGMDPDEAKKLARTRAAQMCGKDT